MYRPPKNHPHHPNCAEALLIVLLFAILGGFLYFIICQEEEKAKRDRTYVPDKFQCGRGIDCYLYGLKDYRAGNYEDAARLLATGCEHNYPASCTLWGRMALEGKNPSATPVEGQRYFKIGCQKGEPDSCHFLADTYYRHFRNRPEGMDMTRWAWHRSCELGSPEGFLGYAGFLAETAQSKQEINTALALLDKTCSLAGPGEICQKAEKLREQILGVPPVKAESANPTPEPETAPTAVPEDPEKLREACSQEDTAACLRLGAYYEHDEGLSPDKRRERAMEIYEKLCQKRDPQGCAEFRRLKNAPGR